MEKGMQMVSRRARVHLWLASVSLIAGAAACASERTCRGLQVPSELWIRAGDEPTAVGSVISRRPIPGIVVVVPGAQMTGGHEIRTPEWYLVTCHESDEDEPLLGARWVRHYYAVESIHTPDGVRWARCVVE